MTEQSFRSLRESHSMRCRQRNVESFLAVDSWGHLYCETASLQRLQWKLLSWVRLYRENFQTTERERDSERERKGSRKRLLGTRWKTRPRTKINNHLVSTKRCFSLALGSGVETPLFSRYCTMTMKNCISEAGFYLPPTMNSVLYDYRDDYAILERCCSWCEVTFYDFIDFHLIFSRLLYSRL